jgi:NADPH:quinone reductase-like Zn-dependent oxidoreductase
MDSLPTTQTAIVGLEDGTLGIATNIPLPGLQDDAIMIRNTVVGLNPVDTKMVGKLVTPGAVAGTDCCGVVIAIGPKAKLSVPFEIGSKVCSAVQGMHSLTPSVGAFAQYTALTAHVTLKVPDGMSFEQGASLGSGIATIGLALFHSLKVPGYPLEPAEKPRHVLVYGGSTATGTLAIQLLKLYEEAPQTTVE